MVISCRSPQSEQNTGSVAGVPNNRSEITQRRSLVLPALRRSTIFRRRVARW
jgi:hypothetical protein